MGSSKPDPRNIQVKNGMTGMMGFVAIGSGIWATGWTLRDCEQNYKKEGGDLDNVEIICYCFEADSSLGEWPFNYDGSSVGINADKGTFLGKTRVYLRLKGKMYSGGGK